MQNRCPRPDPLPENNLDFIRFVLAALVVFSHSFPLMQGISKHEPLVALTDHLSFGWLAVNSFFVLSGFLITHSWFNSRGVGDYLKKRVLRIYPAFVVASLLCIFVVSPLGYPRAASYLKAINWPELLGMTPLLRGYTAPGVFMSLPFPKAVNGSLWTIQYEFWCYLFVALLGVIGALRARIVPLLLLVGALLLYSAQLWQEWQVDIGYAEKFLAGPQEWPRLITYYLAGAVFYFYRKEIPHSIWLALACVAGLLVSAVSWIAMDLALPILGTYLLFYVAFSQRLRVRKFGRYGDFSYGTYLYSFPIQQLLIQQCKGLSNPYILFLLALPLTVFIAALSWYCVERPFLKLKRRAPESLPIPQPQRAVPALSPVREDARREELVEV